MAAIFDHSFTHNHSIDRALEFGRFKFKREVAIGSLGVSVLIVNVVNAGRQDCDSQ